MKTSKQQKQLPWYELPEKRWRNDLKYRSFRDSQRQKLYNAESIVKYKMGESNTKFSSIEEIQKFTNKLVSSAWIKKRFKKQNEIHVILLKKGTPYAQYNGIYLPLLSWNMLVVLHEISHVLHRHGLIPGVSHGRYFARIYLELVGHIMGPDVMKMLKEQYKIYKVKYLPKRELSEETREKLRQGFINRVLKQKVEV